ncbi:hypothetical protein [Kaistia sp. MMO-174]|uniref:hypothetical protein n=1 Tax=Kaistia sp. MMO-174 TaxID=3081256 RepID=UPI003018A07F
MAAFDVQVILSLVDKLTKPAKDAADALKGVGKGVEGGKLGEGLEKAAKGAKDLTDNLKDAAKAAKDAGRAAGGGMARDIQKAARGSQDFARSLVKVEQAAGRVGRVLRGQYDIMLGLGRLYARAGMGAVRIGRKAAVGAGLTGAATLGGAVAIARSYANDIDGQQERAAGLKMKLQTYRELGYAAQLGGASPDAMDEATKTLLENLGKAKSRKPGGPIQNYLGKNNPKLLKTLKKVDLTQDDGSAKALEMVLAALASEKNIAKRKAAAKAMFGGQADDMLLMAQDGPEATKQRRAEGRELMGNVTDEAAQAAAAFNDEIDRMKAALVGVRDEIGQSVIPSLTGLIEHVRTILVQRRPEITAAVTSLVDGIIAAIKAVPWEDVRGSIQGIADGIVSLRDWVGGWKNLALLVAGIGLAPWLVTVTAGVVSLVGALAVLAMTVRGAYAAATASSVIAGAGAAGGAGAAAGAAGAVGGAAGAATGIRGLLGFLAKAGGAALTQYGIYQGGKAAMNWGFDQLPHPEYPAGYDPQTELDKSTWQRITELVSRLSGSPDGAPAPGMATSDLTPEMLDRRQNAQRAWEQQRAVGGLTIPGLDLSGAVDGAAAGPAGEKLANDLAEGIVKATPVAVAAAHKLAQQVQAALSIAAPLIPAPVVGAARATARAVDRSLDGALHDGVTP